MSKKINQLTRSGARRVEDWMLANRERLESENQGSYPAIAETCSKALSIPVTPTNIRSACKAVDVNPKISRSTPLSAFMIETQAHRAAIAALETRVAVIEKKLGLTSALPQAAGQPASLR
jgi:hypothetical protein